MLWALLEEGPMQGGAEVGLIWCCPVAEGDTHGVKVDDFIKQ
jgi:hypothetical protein